MGYGFPVAIPRAALTHQQDLAVFAHFRDLCQHMTGRVPVPRTGRTLKSSSQPESCHLVSGQTERLIVGQARGQMQQIIVRLATKIAGLVIACVG